MSKYVNENEQEYTQLQIVPITATITLVLLFAKVRKSIVSLLPLFLLLCRAGTTLYMFHKIASCQDSLSDDKKSLADSFTFVMIPAFFLLSVKPRLDLLVTIPLTFIANWLTVKYALSDEDGNM